MSQNFEKIFFDKLTSSEINELNPIVLAFIGDGVHTLYVRDKVVKNSNLLVGSCHRNSAKECSAKSQALKLDEVISILTEDEKAVVRRARNAKTNNIAKNSDIETYKKATSYEALIGYLYLKGDYSRLNEIIKI